MGKVISFDQEEKQENLTEEEFFDQIRLLADSDDLAFVLGDLFLVYVKNDDSLSLTPHLDLFYKLKKEQQGFEALEVALWHLDLLRARDLFMAESAGSGKTREQILTEWEGLKRFMARRRADLLNDPDLSS